MHRKTQTPIAATQNLSKTWIWYPIILPVEFAILPNSTAVRYDKKGYNIPLERKNTISRYIRFCVAIELYTFFAENATKKYRGGSPLDIYRNTVRFFAVSRR